MRRRHLLSVLLLVTAATAHALTGFDDSGGSSSGAGLTAGSVRPTHMAGTPPTNGQVPVASASNDWTGRDLVTEFSEPIVVFPEWGKSTANTFDATASTNPYYGKIKFDATGSSATNCGVAIIDNFRNYTATVTAPTVAVRLDQFRVYSGSATDTGVQSYIVRVASITDNVALPSTLNLPHTITVNAGTGSLKPRFQASTASYVDWAPIFDPGAPVMIEICRDGGDASAIDSYGGVMELRLATTAP